MGEEDEAAGAYSPRTADSPFGHAHLELEVPALHLYTDQDLAAQVRQGPRPDPDTVVGGFWAPTNDVRRWSRQTQTWSLPALFHVYGNRWTMKELYGIWCEMPLVLKSPKRGAGPTMKEHLGTLNRPMRRWYSSWMPTIWDVLRAPWSGDSAIAIWASSWP